MEDVGKPQVSVLSFRSSCRCAAIVIISTLTLVFTHRLQVWGKPSGITLLQDIPHANNERRRV